MGRDCNPGAPSPPGGAPAHPFQAAGDSGRICANAKSQQAVRPFTSTRRRATTSAKSAVPAARSGAPLPEKPSLSRAMCAAIKAMNVDDKRARVLLCSTCGYLGPTVVMEAAK